jgi:pimeloyl-ACP methyl ester carboxylesterase
VDGDVRYARNGSVRIAYETFGNPRSAEPLPLIMGLDFQMLWWPDGFCRALANRGFAVARFDNRNTGLSTHVSTPVRTRRRRGLTGRAGPAYTARDMVDDAVAVRTSAAGTGPWWGARWARRWHKGWQWFIPSACAR